MLNYEFLVSQFYVALLGRAPEADGLQFWTQELATGSSAANVADRMLACAPAQTRLSLASHEALIDSFYGQVLDRACRPSEREYWGHRYAPTVTAGEFLAEILEVVSGYTGTDTDGVLSAALFGNRVAAAHFFATHGGSIENAVEVLSGVTPVPQTALNARTLVLEDGASGNYDARGYVEVSLGALSGDIRLSVNADTALHVRSSSSELQVHPPLVEAVVGPRWVVHYDLQDASGTDDHLSIALHSEGGLSAGVFSIPGVEHVTVTSADAREDDDFHSLYLANEDLLSLVLAGNTDVNLPGLTQALIVDASTLAGGLNYTRSPWAETDMVVGGSGDDYLDGTGLLAGGPGADMFRPQNTSSRSEAVTVLDFLQGVGGQGDSLDLAELVAVAEWHPTQLQPAQSASGLDADLDAAAVSSVQFLDPQPIRWFALEGSTYIVIDRSASGTFEDGADQVIRLMGTLDLSDLVLDTNRDLLHI
jgi:hypothetical protein